MNVLVKVKSNAKQVKVEKTGQNCLVVWVKTRPIEGKANQEVIKTLAEYFDVPQSAVNLVKGRTSKEKLFSIST